MRSLELRRSECLNLGSVLPVQVPSSTNLQSMVVDSNGDMKIDLLGIPSSLGGDDGSSLRLWKNVWNGSSDSAPLFEV